MRKKKGLFVLSLGFILGISINVNAATEITVDTSKCLEGDPGSCLITNESYVQVIQAENYDYIHTLCTYKTIDAYYNKNSNVITYEFTDAFENFLASTKDTENDYS